VLEQWSDARADTLSLAEANMILNFGQSADMLAKDGEMSVNSMLTRKLVDIVHGLDPTRPVTSGNNEPSPKSHLFKSGALDIIGYNYHDQYYDSVPHYFPGKPFVGSETVSALMTRGHYKMPSDSVIISPKRWDKPYPDPTFACSSYDNQHAPWSCTHENSLRQVDSRDYVMGQFIWTGFDYIGEPTPYGWPARSSYFGIVDLAGFPKDVYYMYQAEWCPEKTVLHLFPHWNWTPGETVDLWAYYNNADEVELFVNGKSQGVKSKGPWEYHVMWRVPFEAGSIKAVSRKNGKVVAEQVINTAGEPAQIRLTPDRSEIKADGYDLSFVTVDILDKDGNICPLAENEVTFEVTGAGRNEGVDNGSPISLERFKADHRKAMAGKALLIVRNDGTSGNINVKATSAGLTPATVNIKASK
jgi:beta-galactosidase